MNKLVELTAVTAMVVLAWLFSPGLSGWNEIPAGVESYASGPGHAAGTFSSGVVASRLADPPLPLGLVNFRQQYALPPPPNGNNDLAFRIASGTQVFQRAQRLHIDSETAPASWAEAPDTITANRGILPRLLRQPLREVTFNGTRLSELNAVIAIAGPIHVRIMSRSLQADTGLTITGQNVIVDFCSATIDVGTERPLWLVAIRHARDVAVINARIAGGRNGFLVDSGTNIAIEGNDVRGMAENGIVVTGTSSTVEIRDNRLHDLGRAGVMLHGATATALVENNDIDRLRGHSNWNAGIVLTDRSGDISANPAAFFLPDNYWVVPEPLARRLKSPSRNVIMDNTIRGGLSSGIYNDGAIANIFLGNQILGNSKEGICFDNGASANLFVGNVVTGNGQRWGQPDSALALDSVLGAGRGADGTSMAKLPGISIDNAQYNEILGNYVNGNYGGGVKVVRTGLFNIIGANAIVDNNLGHSKNFHFFGVELGAASADTPAVDLDFIGSSGNVVCGNVIRGSHYSGIFIAAGSVQNQFLDNEIVGVRAFTVEFQRR